MPSKPPTLDDLVAEYEKAREFFREAIERAKSSHRKVEVGDPQTSALLTIAAVADAWLQVHGAAMNYDDAFVRYTKAQEAAREAAAEARETAREQRESAAEARESQRDARDRRVQEATTRETHWIKWATVVIAVAAVVQAYAAYRQAMAPTASSVGAPPAAPRTAP